MPTLKLVASPSKNEGNGEKKRCQHPNDSSADGNNEDDRFSQTPNDTNNGVVAFDTKLVASSDPKGESIDPYLSIAAALSNHHNRTTRVDKGNNSKLICNAAAITDVVVVILSTPIINEQTAAHISKATTTNNKRKIFNNGYTRVNLLVGDYSLCNVSEQQQCCARITMNISSSSNSNSINQLSKLQPGDVVRWNNLEVRNYDDCYYTNNIDGKKESTTRTKKKHKKLIQSELLNVICDMSTSWLDPPESGTAFAHLCRIVPKQSSLGQDDQEAMFDLIWENNDILPPSMKTSNDFVHNLARWYCSTNSAQLSKSAANLPITQQQQPTCIRRKLRDINVTNMTSHIVVRVLRCEKAVSKNYYSTPNKNKFNNTLSNYSKDCSLLTHVTLCDGSESDDILGMTGVVAAGGSAYIPKSISPTLLQSMKEGSRVLLTYVSSQNSSTATIGALQGRETLMLVPTRETTATILTPDHPFFVHNESRSTAKEDDDDDMMFASQPLTLEMASQMYTMTQQHSQLQTSITQQGKNDSLATTTGPQRRGVMSIVSPLHDIIVDGIDTSFLEGKHWQSVHRLSNFLIACPKISTGLTAIALSPTYRSATLLLDPKFVARDIVVNADGNALKMICMDVPVEDMIINDASTAGSSLVNLKNRYLGHVGELLRGFCMDRSVLIRWVLEQESECNWFVTDATLVEV